MVKRLVAITFCLFLVACSSIPEIKKTEMEEDKKDTELEAVNGGVVEDKRIYDSYKEKPIVHLYVTILGEEQTGKKAASFYELNQSNEGPETDENDPSLDIIFQEGDENGPNGKFSSVDYLANATIEQRGNSSRREVQKSYKIKLKENTELWMGQDTLNLNKHVMDPTRVKNKLSFDYFRMIENLTSLRTQFVELHVKDLTASPPDDKFSSYGLYTHVEQVNKDFLATRGLNPYGQLYKVSNFEFFRYPDKIKMKDDPAYDKNLFETVLEIKGDEDHSKLIKMLEDVNDTTININDIINTHFDRENYVTWLAVNILFGNVDTMTNNYYLYSPLNSTKWYFLPWDYDKAWGWNYSQANNPSWQTGLERYWGSVLHKRFLKDPENLKAVVDKIENLSSIVNPEQTKKLLEQYLDEVNKLVGQSPDLTYYPFKIEDFQKKYFELINQPSNYKKIFYDRLEYPMPIFLNTEVKQNQVIFKWDMSFDFQGDPLTYKLQISKDPYFKEVFYEKDQLTTQSHTLTTIPSGQYYWRVLIQDDQGHEQIPFDKVMIDGKFIWGVDELVIK